jgi:hypothetical protein
MKDDKSPQSETQQNYYDFPERLKTPALWIVVLMYVLVIIFYFLNINAKYDSTDLNIILNTIFVVIPSLVIAFIATRSFLRTGNWPVLWMGVGTLSFGLAVLLSFLVRFWWPVIVGLTNFPIIVLFAGLFYFLAALFLFSRTPPYEHGRGRIAILLSVNIIAIVMAIIVTIISILNILPPFFIQGVGSTASRQIILIIAALLFLISAVTIYQQYRKSKFLMLYWLALGLLLIFLTISANLLVISIGTPAT